MQWEWAKEARDEQLVLRGIQALTVQGRGGIEARVGTA